MVSRPLLMIWKKLNQLFVRLTKTRKVIWWYLILRGNIGWYIGDILCDPEIAIEHIVNIDDEFLFCLGNLATNAIQAFFGAHECNTYCEAVIIPDKE